ncbi:probable phosphomevalonate kinase isoform X1 [Glossina fuscipes]|uniref:Phosphomevalonate kinase n=2 Tax=Nemorhina TaxID=44051 RepID=A0A9C5ZDF0_9MUSC|nr:probable phosphomevalonate kinase isoform X1 [Glossina fuscipes]
MTNVKHIILISGKRKCGKDYISEKLQKRLGECSQIVRISEPIKKEWSRKDNVGLQELLSDGPLKEKYRKDMIKWGEELRQKDYGFFCKLAMDTGTLRETVIVSDIRRKSDIKYFKECYNGKVLIVRITCSEETRIKRGWIFRHGVDDVESECDLDDYENWDLTVENNGHLDGDEIINLIISEL